MVVDDFVNREKLGNDWKYENKFRWDIIKTPEVIFLKPMEFMNRSWWAVGALANFYKIEPKDILILHDDIDLPMSKIQLKLWWSSGGHNWLKDIIAVLDTPNFRRLRVGISRPTNQNDVADYVLHAFKKEEKNLIDDKMNSIEGLIQKFLST